MIVYPGLFVLRGEIVQLSDGTPTGEDPVKLVEQWAAAGATWLHMANMDGSFADAAATRRILRKVARVGVKVQLGGGLRSLDEAAYALQEGATRVVLGTLAIQNPTMARTAVRRFGIEHITVALDFHDSWVAINHWQRRSFWTPSNLGKRFAVDGVRHVLLANVRRAGTLAGLDVRMAAQVAQETGLHVIAAGGVASLDDITALCEVGGIAGVAFGTALQMGTFTLEDAIKAAQCKPKQPQPHD